MKTNKREYNPPAIDEVYTEEWITASEVGISDVPAEDPYENPYGG